MEDHQWAGPLRASLDEAELYSWWALPLHSTGASEMTISAVYAY